ncbi:MAG: HPr(Ser) kinase/phosphatase [Fusobacteria bacterium]|nr:HPr(Ser) kinase/phosphatase [Fusobacteriota bacterium]
MQKKLTVEELAELFHFELLFGENTLEKEISVEKIYLPGMEFYSDKSDEDKGSGHVQLIEYTILHYLKQKKLSVEKKLIQFFQHDYPCIIVRDRFFFEEHKKLIEKYCKCPILYTPYNIIKLQGSVEEYLTLRLTPETIIDGYVFLDVLGMGILLTGHRNSKFGAAIDLLKRGHRLICNEHLQVKRVHEHQLMGYNPKYCEFQKGDFSLELTNGQKIDVETYFGMWGIREYKKVDLIIEFEILNELKTYDRLGLDAEYFQILNVNVPKLTIPVKDGRNLAILVEAAAMNERSKELGIHSAENFCKKVNEVILENKKQRGILGMDFNKIVTPEMLINQFKLGVVSGKKERISTTKITSTHIYVPTLELAGYFDVLEESNALEVHYITQREVDFFMKVEKEVREQSLNAYLQHDIKLIIIDQDAVLTEYFLEVVMKSDKIVVRLPASNKISINSIQEYLDNFFAREITMHGIFMEIYGFGVMITGQSGLGKSEAALELIHRKHRFVVDDKVKFIEKKTGEIVGSADKIPHFMEIRGLGIIDIKALYGVGAIKERKRLDVIVNLKEVSNQEKLEASDFKIENSIILTQSIPTLDLYIFAGRNAATLIELAVMSVMMKKIV